MAFSNLSNNQTSNQSYHQSRSRISYVIPLSNNNSSTNDNGHKNQSIRTTPSILQVPEPGLAKHHSRNHDPRPLIIRLSNSKDKNQQDPSSPSGVLYSSSPSLPPSIGSGQINQQPRHCLGINALALDFSSVIQDRNGPEGILYTAGKDGLVAAWDLGIPTKPREVDEDDYSHQSYQKSDLPSKTETAEYDFRSNPSTTANTNLSDHNCNSPYQSKQQQKQSLNNGDGEQLSSNRRSADHTPYETRYQVDRQSLDQAKPPPSTLRQCVQSHTDWCNDIVLCNYNQTLISASSDRTLKAWYPHSPHLALSPTTIGSHSDYVKCLAHSRDLGWVASGGLDRKIKIWDIHEARINPVVSFPNDNSISSIYSLATNPAGSLLAAGSPSRTVATYDPRIFSQIGELVGHTDNVRSILLSEDGRHLLSGSGDATVKLWDIGMRRCLYTFSHHSTSVWALFSRHPRLEVFHSGDRAGWVCKVDLEDCGELGEGECVALCKVGQGDKAFHSSITGSENVVKITGADDIYIWTATGSSSVQRWCDIPTRRQRRLAASIQPVEVPGIASSSTTLNLSPGPLSFITALDTAAQPSPQPSAIIQSEKLSPSTPTPSGVQVPSHLTTPSPSQISTYFHQQQFKPSVLHNSKKDGLPLEALVPLISPSDPIPHSFGSLVNAQGQTLELITTPSVTSFHSSMSMARSPTWSQLGGHVAANPPGIGSLSKFSPFLAEPQLQPLGKAMLKSFSPKNLPPEEYQAWKLYQTRDSAADCVPLQDSPDSVIAGCSGLLKCELLNDRRHAVTVDTTGQVALWDIICGTCIGTFATNDCFNSGNSSGIEDLSLGATPNEMLKAIKERIEGEATTETWCSVETQAGLLTVHLEEPRCFEAGIYADEADLLHSVLCGMKEDHRILLGKWVMRNLFDGFISYQAKLRSLEEESKPINNIGGDPTAVESSAPGIASPPFPWQRSQSISDALVQVSAESNITPNLDSLSKSENIIPCKKSVSTRTPGMTISLATPASTPVIPPEFKIPSTRPQPINEPNITVSGPNPAASIPLAALGPDSHFDSSDCFALSSLAEMTDEEREDHQQQEFNLAVGAPRSEGGSSQGSLLNSIPLLNSTRQSSMDGNLKEDNPAFVEAVNRLNNNLTPQHLSLSSSGGLFTRFKALGRSPKRRPSHEVTSLPVISKPILRVNGADSQDSSQAIHSQKNLERLQYQRQILQEILAKPFSPADDLDAPRLELSPETAILISEESEESGAWEVTYRGLVSTTEGDSETLENVAPGWLLDFLLGNRTITKDGAIAKVTFVLQPEGGKEVAGIEELPNGNARLTASKVLRIRKVSAYIVQKLEIDLTKTKNPFKSRKSNNGDAQEDIAPEGEKLEERVMNPQGNLIKPEEEIELFCNGLSLPWKMSLGAVKQWVWCKGGDVVIGYRWRRY